MLRMKIKYKVVMIQYLKEKDMFTTWKKFGFSTALGEQLGSVWKVENVQTLQPNINMIDTPINE